MSASLAHCSKREFLSRYCPGRIFLDKRKQALRPCSEKRARLLPGCGLAVAHRLYPFTIRSIDE
ncbi:hypothetical protein FJZ55_04900 [Candidatus Woesearchaeota archaeon]|nr:hypothetical protein [Candidatus Woesearchaeota archaeon]